MARKVYWRNLQLEHQQSVAQSVGPGPIDEKQNLLVAGVCASAALTLLAIGGYWICFDAVHGVGRYLSAAFLESLSELGATLPAICLTALLAKRHPRVVWMGILAIGYAELLTHSIKVLCNTARPPAVLGDWTVVTGPILRHYSFPSGHAVTAFLLAGCFAVGAPRNARLLLYALAAAAAVSRIWIGVHWPIDVIAGAGIAGLSIALAIRTMRVSTIRPGLMTQLCVVSVIALSAVLELKMGAEYPLTHLLHVTVGTVSLAVLVRDYVLQPLFPDRTGLRSIPVSTAPSDEVVPPSSVKRLD